MKDDKTLVVRGGSWVNSQDLARADSRSHDHPGNRDDDLGFRVVCGSPVKPKEKQSER